jgi:hypothetical protein
MAKSKSMQYEAPLVWAAATAAQRINGSYVKLVAEGTQGKTNRELVNSLLREPSLITEEDYSLAESARTHFKGLVFKILGQGRLNDFENTAMLIANKDIIDSNYDIAVLASLPSSYERAVRRDMATQKLRDASGGVFGSAGDRVVTSVEIVSSNYSQQWAVWFVRAITDKDEPVLFSYREQLESGRKLQIRGTVKGHRDNATQLNRVKII